MIRDRKVPECHALPSQTGNLPERPPGSLLGDNPSGWAFGRMGQIHMGRANPFGALVAGLTADESLLLGEAVSTWRGLTACWSGTAGSRAKHTGQTSTTRSTWSGWRWWTRLTAAWGRCGITCYLNCWITYLLQCNDFSCIHYEATKTVAYERKQLN